MLRFSTRRVELKKLYPLAISRGTSYGSTNLFVEITDGTHTGIGEAAPGAGFDETLAPLAEAQLAEQFPTGEILVGGEEPSIHTLNAHCREAGIASPAVAALDCAMWDLRAKQAGMPLYQLLGLDPRQAPTSVTIGLNPPEVTRERVLDILRRTGGQSLKIKLGSPQGEEFDREHFEAAREAASPFGVRLRVDANGGWDVPTARRMIAWLAERGVDYVEQPLPEGSEGDLAAVHEGSPLPIFVDESCRYSNQIPNWAAHVDGVNLKLMKCGGITEALRIVATARAFGLQTMIGCMGESSVAIGSGAAIGSLFDHIDLDSHLNLNPDPSVGLGWEGGTVIPPDRPVHGARLLE